MVEFILWCLEVLLFIQQVDMRYWLDTEFVEDGSTIELISIGIVAEDGREYYAINSDCDLDKANDWVKENVIANLEPKNQAGATFWKPKSVIKQGILGFIGWRSGTDPHWTKPEFWGYYSDYDWVVLCQIFGSMMDLPSSWPMYCRDIKQWCDYLGNPQLPEQGKGKHNALADAHWNKKAWEFLRIFEEDCVVERG